jgi:hypothetical protein
MTSPQASRILAVVSEYDRSTPVAPWLAHLEAVLTEPALDPGQRSLADRSRTAAMGCT